MAGTALFARITDVRANTVVASGTYVFYPTWSVELDGPGDGAAFIPFGTHLGDAVLAAIDAPTFGDDDQVYAFQLWINGGTGRPVFGFLIDNVDVEPQARGIQLGGPGLYAGYEWICDEQDTFVNCPLPAVLFGDAGTVPLGSESGTPTLALGRVNPKQKGVGKILPGSGNWKGRALLAHTFGCDPILNKLKITLAITADKVQDGVIQAAKVAGSTFNPQDSAPYGSRQHFSVDPINQTVTVGYLGKAVKLTLIKGDPTTTSLHPSLNTAYLDARGFVVSKDLRGKRAQISLRGGPSNHGLPDGWRFTDNPIAIQTDHLPGEVAWDASLPVVCGATGSEGGGVYYYAHDHLYRQMSQTMDVWCLAYDPQTNTLYAGTSKGVFWTIAATGVQLIWQRLGGMTAKVTKIWVPARGVVYCLAAPATGAGTTGLYRHPLLVGDDNGEKVGHKDWSRASLLALADAAGDDTAMYLVAANNPNQIILHRAGHDDHTPIILPNSEVVVGLDYLPATQKIFVRTELGADGFYVMGVGDTVCTVSANPQGSGPGGLADDAGPLTVTKVNYHGQPRNGLSTALLATTDRGVYYSPHPTGGNWESVQAQNGLGAIQANFVAGGAPQTVLGRVLTRLWCASDTAFWESNFGGVEWEEVTALPVTGLPAFTEICRQLGYGFPDGNLGALGNTGSNQTQAVGSIVQVGQPIPTNPVFADTGGSGAIRPIPAGNGHVLPDNVIIARRLTTPGNQGLRVVDLASTSPQYATEMAEAPGIVADDATGAVAAADDLILLTYREMAQRRTGLLSVKGTFYWTDPNHVAPTLVGGDLIAITYAYSHPGQETTSQVVAWTARTFYLSKAKHAFVKGRWKTDFVAVGNTVLSMEDLAAETDGILYGLHQQRQRPGRR